MAMRAARYKTKSHDQLPALYNKVFKSQPLFFSAFRKKDSVNLNRLFKTYSCSPYLSHKQECGSARVEWGGSQMPTHRKAGGDQYYKTLRRDVVNSGLDLDKLHVLKIRNREAGESFSNGVMTKDKFSKYSPLPAIKRPPVLMREKTYDVLEPVYVRGPIKEKPGQVFEKEQEPPTTRVKLPEIRQPPTSAIAKKTRRTPSRSDSCTPKKPQPQVQPLAIKKDAKVKSAPRRHAFRPQELSKDILPESPTAFWFPI